MLIIKIETSDPITTMEWAQDALSSIPYIESMEFEEVDE